MKSRILVIGQLPPPVHGSNVMTERFMEALAVNGYSSEIVQKTFSNSMSEVGKISYRKVLKVPDLCRRVLTEVRGQRPDMCVYFISVGLRSLLVDCLVLRLLRKQRIPYILYFHGKGYNAYEAPRYLPVRRVIRVTLKGAVGGMVLGERLKEDVSHCIPDDRLFVLPNGIPPIDNARVVAAMKDDDMVRVVFLSNLIPAKGPMRFLKMAERVHAEDQRVRFTLAGRHTTDQYLRELKEFIACAGLGDCIELLGPVYGQDKVHLFQEMDILVFPTDFKKETFGIVNIEAMQWGVPVVSSPVGSIPEIIRDGINGFIVDPDDVESLADRVLRLVRDKNLRQSMGNAGRELYERNYSKDAYVNNVRNALLYFAG